MFFVSCLVCLLDGLDGLHMFFGLWHCGTVFFGVFSFRADQSSASADGHCYKIT